VWSVTARSVVITGAAGGIGAALARRFVRDGARVALLDSDGDGASALADELGRAATIARRCDVTRLDDCAAAMTEVVDTWGGIDILVNNAGITHVGTFAQTDVDVIRRVVDVNLFGAVNCTKAALESLVRSKGQIIVISSVAGVAPLATRTGYSASKHALHGFFDSLRAEHLADGVRVMIVCPSFVDTAIGDRALAADGTPAAPDARTGPKQPVAPATIADAIVTAAAKDRRLLLVPREARVAYWAARLVPRAYDRLMLRRVGGTRAPAP
jgi:NAD(P)-dependent dehydrogenase (short-subunit alcohol dehydrogenase family)